MVVVSVPRVPQHCTNTSCFPLLANGLVSQTKLIVSLDLPPNHVLSVASFPEFENGRMMFGWAFFLILMRSLPGRFLVSF